MPDDSWMKSVHHDGSPYYVVGEALQIGSTLTLRIRADAEAPIARVFLRTTPNGGQYIQEMHPASREKVARWWETELKLQMPRTDYRFFLQLSQGGYWFYAGGITRHAPTDATDFKILANYQNPAWVQSSV